MLRRSRATANHRHRSDKKHHASFAPRRTLAHEIVQQFMQSNILLCATQQIQFKLLNALHSSPFFSTVLRASRAYCINVLIAIWWRTRSVCIHKHKTNGRAHLRAHFRDQADGRVWCDCAQSDGLARIALHAIPTRVRVQCICRLWPPAAGPEQRQRQHTAHNAARRDRVHYTEFEGGESHRSSSPLSWWDSARWSFSIIAQRALLRRAAPLMLIYMCVCICWSRQSADDCIGSGSRCLRMLAM